jgi:hypothetical protein
VSALSDTVVVEVYNGTDTLMASGTMAAPWATAGGATITVGEVTGVGLLVTTGGAPDANWYCQFRSGSRFVRGTFGVAGSGRDFVWSLASFQTGSRGTLGTITLIASGTAAPPASATARIFSPIDVSTGALGGVSPQVTISSALDSQRASQSLETFLLNCKTAFANCNLTLLLGGSVVGTGTGTADGKYGGQFTSISGLTATGSGDAPSPGLIDITGSLTTTQTINPTQSLVLRITSQSNSALFFDLVLSEKGAAGWMDRAAASAATIAVRFNARVKTALPANHYAICLLENQDGVYSGTAQKFPYVDNLTKGAGDVVHPRIFRFTHTAGRTLSLTVPATINGSPYSQTLKVRVNGGAWVDLFTNGASTPINEADYYEFAIARLGTGSASLSQTMNLFISGLKPGETHWLFAENRLLYRNDNNGTHTPVIYTVGPAKTYANIGAIQASLKAGDTVRLQRGVAHTPVRLTKGGAVGAPVVFEPDPADSSALPAPIFDYAVNGALAPLYVGDDALRQIFCDELVNHLTFRGIDFKAGRSVPADNAKKVALHFCGRGVLVENVKFTDSDMGFLIGDRSTGNAVIRRNVFSNCGLMALKNGHGTYVNQDSGAWPDDWVLFEHNVELESHGQGLPTRGARVIARANWIEMNQETINPNYQVVDGPGQTQTATAGNGRGGQSIMTMGAQEQYTNYFIQQTPLKVITNNIGVSSVDDNSPFNFSGDPVGRVALDHVICAHNSMLWKNSVAYRSMVSIVRSPKVVNFANNAVYSYDNVGSFETFLPVNYFDIREHIGIPASTFHSNAWQTASEIDQFPALGAKINFAQNTKLSASPFTLITAPFNFVANGVMPAAQAVAAGGLWEIPALATTPIASDMPELNGVVPYDLRKRPWSTRPNITVALVPPADAALAPTLVGAL